MSFDVKAYKRHENTYSRFTHGGGPCRRQPAGCFCHCGTSLAIEDVRAPGRDRLANSHVDLANSRVDFANSRVDLANSRVDLANSRVDLANSRVDFANSHVDLANSHVDFANSRVVILAS